ncbi:MAG: DUF4878 domain-containing protein [Arcobacter sp.]|jgi:major membrane immunogen (membrane-anchored lipoprotein)|uniref:DUF4878 domain-containing protein n=1 Tax=Arcobacter sp. TaxID=1872629 RepID=UPI00258A1818|nr:DUF4878 domain-containing protein [Arcobacter sp.]MDD3009146.1 DUF4878 domain-containing protein [Arcobacter sp.]MDY3203924.1 DUF4878 domain-containing protein [Arcobacter sp.]
MKKNGILISLAALLLTACGSSNPKDVTESFVNALQSGDLKVLQELSTPTTFSLINMSLSMQCGEKDIPSCAKEMSKNEVVKDYVAVSQTETEAVVNVKIEKNGNLKNSRYDLIKTENGWKVNLKK